MPTKTPLHRLDDPCGAAQTSFPGAGARPDVSQAEMALIGLVLVTHGRLAQELRAALEHVVGRQTNVEGISIEPDDDIEQRRSDIVSAVKRVDTGAGVVILTDMFGGTPSNLAISVMEKGRVEVIAGVNLPMLVKLSSVRANMPLNEAVIAARDAGVKYISVASQVLSGQ